MFGTGAIGSVVDYSLSCRLDRTALFCRDTYHRTMSTDRDSMLHNSSGALEVLSVGIT